MQNGIMDEGGLAPFDMAMPAEQLADEKLMAKYSKSKEFRRLKEHMQGRIEFYQQYLPDGRALTEVDAVERANHWLVANIVIKEFNLVIDSYGQIAEAVKNAERKNG
jgi:hypothetical protein